MRNLSLRDGSPNRIAEVKPSISAVGHDKKPLHRESSYET